MKISGDMLLKFDAGLQCPCGPGGLLEPVEQEHSIFQLEFCKCKRKYEHFEIARSI